MSGNALIVFAAAPGRLEGLRTYFDRRGVSVRMRVDFKTFLADVVEMKPDFVLMSVDAKHGNIEQVRRLMEQVYQVTVIDFAEEQTLTSFQALKAIPSLHKIEGEISGPKVEKLIASIRPALGKVDSGFRLEDLQASTRDWMNYLFQSAEEPSRRIERCTHLTCVQIRSGSGSGHFLMALGGDRLFDDNIMGEVQEEIARALDKMGIFCDDIEFFPVEIRQVDFKDWAASEAAFVERASHRGMEVAIAFFPVEEQHFVLTASRNGSFLLLKTDEVPPDTIIDFDLFLHMPLNGRMVLYVSRGGQLSLQQQLGLQTRQVKHLCVRREDASEVVRGRTVRRFNSMISSFYESRIAA